MIVRFAGIGVATAAALGSLAVATDRLLAARGARDDLPIDTFVVVDAPPADVWAVLADMPGQPRWMTDLKAVELLDPPPIRAGSRARGIVRILGIPVADPVTITAFDAPNRFAIRHDGLFAGDGTIELRPGADGRSTIVRWRERLVPPLLPHLAGRVQRPILRRVFQADLHRLRRLVERPA
ncbi:MAG TPA: SRPBCC family protein [Candidatus Limnocylindrales bacterium]